MDDSPHAPGHDDWLRSERPEPGPTRATTTSGAARLGHRLRTGWKAGALVLAGLIAGGGTVAVAQAVGDDHPRAAVADRGGPHAGFPRPPGAPGRPAGPGRAGAPGGLAGEQRVQGTVTGTTSAAVSVRTSSGSATYTVTDQTQIVRDGSVASLGDLEPGDAAVVQLHPSSGGGQMTAERIFASTT